MNLNISYKVKISLKLFYALCLFSLLLIPANAIMPPEFYGRAAKESRIKAIAVVTDVKVINETSRSTSKEVFFKTEKSFGGRVPEEFSGGCDSVDHEWQNPGVGGTRYIYPHKKERVFVTVGSNGGYITSYTRLASNPEMEKELHKNGLKNISFGYDVEIDRDYLKESYSKACNSGDMNGCLKLAFLYQRAHTHEERQEVKGLFNKACSGGLLSGCVKLAKYSYVQDKARAKELYIKACNGGNMTGCFNLAWMYSQGAGVQQDNQKAKALYEKACNGGNMSGCYNLGSMYDTGTTVKQDRIKAEELYKKACDGGEYMGCFILEMRLNYEACHESGDMNGCLKLGKMYYNGNKIIKADRKKSKELYRKACDGGLMSGCLELGLVYHFTDNTKEEKEKAKELILKACNGNNTNGCLVLGKMYYFGKGVTLDKKRAKELFLKACTGGNTGGCIQLSDILRRGCHKGNLKDCKEREILFK